MLLLSSLVISCQALALAQYKGMSFTEEETRMSDLKPWCLLI